MQSSASDSPLLKPAPAGTRSQAGYVSSRLFRAIAFPAACFFLTAFVASLLFSGCEDGTSSGVDNPKLTVSFQDPAGAALRVTGDLNVYGQDQNPTVSPQPLWTIKLNNTSIINLTADDIARINDSAAAKYAVGKVAAGSASARSQVAASTSLAFNLQLKTEDRKGQFAFGLFYNSVSKAFSKTAGPTEPTAALTRLGMQAKPLVRFQARIIRDGLTGTLNRVFIPGTPFQATLVDSAFVFEELPEGTFSLRFLAADGHVFAVNESLDTQFPRNFTSGLVPISSGDTGHFLGTDSLLSVSAGPDREVYMDAPVNLEASLKVVDPKDPRLAILWRQLHRSGDSILAGDTIRNPTLPKTEVKFLGEGAYTFEVAATLGRYTRLDTVILSVKKIPPPAQPRIIQPHANDTLLLGKPYPITWEMPVPGPVTVRASPDNGMNWFTLVEHLDVKGGPAIFNWTPSGDFLGALRAVVLVRLESDTSKVALSDGTFVVGK